MIQARNTRDGQPAISAVLSVHNRRDSLEDTILDATAVLDGLVDGAFEIVVVDDGSTDATPDLLAELRVRRPNLPLRLVRHPTRRGMATAMSSGFDAAGSDLIFCMPVDGQFDVCELNRLLDGLDDDTDLVIGYRAGRSDGVLRRLSSWSYNGLVNLLFGHTARDVDCGFKLFRREVWQAVRKNDAALRGETFNAELMVRARRCGFRVREVPVRQRASDHADEPSLFGPTLLALMRLRRQLPTTACT
jgi:glycosyltransferase involved in cell wall biosynthesis